MPRFFCFWLALVTLPCLRVTAQPQTIAVVNMVPQSNSGETYQDSEASLAINPANPAQMAATAITTDPRYGSKGPIYFSLNGGSAWGIVAIVPSVSGSPFPYVDATVDFGASNTLYAAILKSQGAGQPMPTSILKAPNFPSVSVMTEMPGSGRQDVDQPHLHAAIINTGSSRRDIIFVGDDDYDIDPLFLGRTAAIDQFNQTAFGANHDPSPGHLGSRRSPYPSRHPSESDGPRKFLARRSIGGTGTGQYFNTDLILVCDRASGTGLRTFKALTDSDGKSGASRDRYSCAGHAIDWPGARRLRSGNCHRSEKQHRLFSVGRSAKRRLYSPLAAIHDGAGLEWNRRSRPGASTPKIPPWRLTPRGRSFFSTSN